VWDKAVHRPRKQPFDKAQRKAIPVIPDVRKHPMGLDGVMPEALSNRASRAK